MILAPTTFVIGAGASCPYGLPTGPELCEKARRLNHESDIYQLILSCSSIPADALNGFLEDLRRHPADSIDGFLETRQSDARTMQFGRYVIAALMGDLLRSLRDKKPPRDADWLGYVFGRMLRGANTYGDFCRNRVTFVTFNFDTIVENHFFSNINNAYRKDSSDFSPVIHVHGALPTVPDGPMRSKGWIDWLPKAASNINVVLDEIDKGILDAARTAVLEARVICFLGFAYATPNLERLGLPDALGKNPPIGDMYGSAYGLRDGERDGIRTQLHNRVRLGEERANSLDVLREFPIFRQ
jgi:hypothetical protein